MKNKSNVFVTGFLCFVFSPVYFLIQFTFKSFLIMLALVIPVIVTAKTSDSTVLPLTLLTFYSIVASLWGSAIQSHANRNPLKPSFTEEYILLVDQVVPNFLFPIFVFCCSYALSDLLGLDSTISFSFAFFNMMCMLVGIIIKIRDSFEF